jgi:hypothetical protein
MLVVTTPATSDSSSSQRKWVWVVLIMILLLGGGAYAVWRALNKAPPPSPNATPSPTPDPGPLPDKDGFKEVQGYVQKPTNIPSPGCAPASQTATSDRCYNSCINYFKSACKIDFPDTKVAADANARYSAATYDDRNQTCSCYSMTIPHGLGPEGVSSDWCVNTEEAPGNTSWVNYQPDDIICMALNK